MANLPGKLESGPAPASGRCRRLLVGAGMVLLCLGVAGWLLGAWLQWRAGREATQRYDFPEALEHFERCLRVWPAPSVRLEAARAARRGNRYDRFEELLSACEKSGTTTETALERELVLVQQGAFKPDVELALQQLADEDHAQAVSILEALAKGYITSFRLGHAMVALEKLIERAPDHKWAYFWRGNMHAQNEHMLDGVADFRKAVKLDPKIPEFRVALAVALVSVSKVNDAWPLLAELIRERPDNPDVLLNAAVCQCDFGDHQRALDYLQQLLAKYPDHAEGLAERGRILGAEGEGGEALVCLRRAFQLEPRSYSIGWRLFNELKAQGKHAEAKAVKERIDRLRKRDERVKKIIEQLGKDGRNVALRHEVGTLFLDAGNEPIALRWLESVLQIDPGYQPTHKVLADYYERHGQTSAAAHHRQQTGRPAQ